MATNYSPLFPLDSLKSGQWLRIDISLENLAVHVSFSNQTIHQQIQNYLTEKDYIFALTGESQFKRKSRNILQFIHFEYEELQRLNSGINNDIVQLQSEQSQKSLKASYIDRINPKTSTL